MLDTWRASPTRFREDANAEEDLLRGGYRDRWFVELAQNAADAAARAGRPTRLAVDVVPGADPATGPELRVGACGEPLDADGVAALASLRASAKRDPATGSVGRFGVGFAAVTAISDAPRVVSRSGAVGFDRQRTAHEVARTASDLPGGALAAELERRGDAVPALRLAWPVEETPPPGIDTEVRLPLRPGVDPDALLAVAHEQSEDLLLALPWLSGIDVAGVPVDRTGVPGVTGRVVVADREWHVLRCGGELPASALTELAVEERTRTSWAAVWAVPRDGLGDEPQLLGAPTPTDERTTLPARLLADLPLEPDRRHVRPGPATEHVLAGAAAAYPELVRSLAPERRADLLPRPGLPASAVDATLRDAVGEALATTPWLPGAGTSAEDVAPRRAVVLEPALEGCAPLLADVVPDLVDPDAGVGGADRAAALAALGVTRLSAADLCDRLAGVARDPGWWHALYDGLGAVDRSELAALPVPLADGRTVIGPRGTLLTPPDGDAGSDAAGLSELLREAAGTVPGLRVVAPAAAHGLLARLGAEPGDPSALLGTPALVEAVERSLDDAEAGLDPLPLADLVLGLLARGAEVGDDLSAVLGGLALLDEDGEPRRADELVLPDGTLRPLLGADSPVGVLDPAMTAAAPRDALVALGVLDGFAVLRDDAPAGPDHDLDDEETWWAEEVEPADPATLVVSEPAPLLAVRDLELVEHWEVAWPVLAADRAVREALRTAPGGTRPYTAWWLARHARLAGRAPGAWRLATATALAGLYDVVPSRIGGALDQDFLAAVGVRAELVVADADDAADLLARLGDPERAVDGVTAALAHAALAAAVVDGRVAVADVEPPERVRTADGGAWAADPERAPAPVVLDAPWLLDVLDPAEVITVAAPSGAAALAELLDAGLASRRVRGLVRSGGRAVRWGSLPDVVAWAGARGWPVPEGEVVVHERLHVLVTDDERPGGGPVEHTPRVWVDDGGVLHTDDPVRAFFACR